jgi:flagellar biosynthesis protein FlhF
MNVKRFTARTSRDALNLVKQAFGDDAVVLSTRPCPEGIEVLAMAPDGIQQIERVAAPAVTAPAAKPAPKPAAKAARPAAQRSDPVPPVSEVDDDVAQLSMSTLSFQDYVRERVLRRRQAEVGAAEPQRTQAPLPQEPEPARPAPKAPVLRDAVRVEPVPVPVPALADMGPSRRDQQDMLNELRSMKGLIEERFGALAFMEKLQRSPKQAQLTQKLLDVGFSPALIRKMVDGLAADTPDEMAWATSVLERNLVTGETEAALEDQGGVYALIGSTGVGKTTSTAKIAAAFATKHGAANLGLVTLDAYRMGAHEQLRAYGRILGVPVHTAHDRASLEDLLELLAGKKMVLIDTAGIAQRDARTRDMLEMLSHRSIRKLLVVNASAQGETIEDVMVSWRAATCHGVVLSKIDEAVKLGPALDALIRHKLKVVGVANGQRVPEDWHRLSAHALVHRALRGGGSPSWRIDASDVSLIFAGQRSPAAPGAMHA